MPSPDTVTMKQIVTQALEYIRTINLSIAVAQSGFTVAVEALALAESMPHSTDAERLAYLKGMSEIVKDARMKSEEIIATFKDVRRKVYSVCMRPLFAYPLLKCSSSSQNERADKRRIPPSHVRLCIIII
jgi:hypothetical protein